MSIEIKQRKAKFSMLKPYDYFANEDDFIEVTEWTNGEGFDVTLSARNDNKSFSLTYGEYDALQVLVAYKE